VGSLATMVTAVIFGFTVAMAAGCGCYLLASAASRGLGRDHPFDLDAYHTPW